MKSIDITMTSIEVKAEVRPLRCSWTAEMAKDLNSFHGLDPYVFERTIRREVRREKIKNIFNNVKP